MKRIASALIVLTALLGLAAPARADQLLPQGRILDSGPSSGDILFGALKLGNRQAGKTTLTPDAVAIQGSGSTGDVSGMSVAFPSLATRTLLDRLLERPSVIDFGVDMTGVADSSAAFSAALNSGRRVTAPCGTIRLVSMVSVSVTASFEGSGACTVLKYDALATTPAAPLLNILPSAPGSTFDNFAFDHQANVKNYPDTTLYGGNLIAGSAILIQADDVSMSRVIGKNAADNCIAVQQQDASNPVLAKAGSPKHYSLTNIRTFNCGVNKYKAGAGIDIASGAHGVVDNLVDVGSSAAFILDVGAGAQGEFSNLVGITTRFDAALFASQGQRSHTFYIGSSDSKFTNLTSIDAGDRGLWLDGFADRTTISGLSIKAPAAEAMYVKATEATISGLTIWNVGYNKPTGTVDAILLDTSFQIKSLRFIGPRIIAGPTMARYAISQSGANTATGYALGADFSGAVTALNGVSPTFAVADVPTLAALTGAWTSYTPTLTCETGTPTNVSASGTYRLVGKTVNYQASANVTDKGTCAGAMFLGLPVAASGQRVAFAGIETALTGNVASATIFPGTSTVRTSIKRSDGTTLFVNGASVNVGGTYQAQ